MRHFLKYDAVPLLSMAAVCAFPCVFLYSQNAAEVPASSMLPFFLVFLVNALLFLGVTGLFFRNVSRAAFFTDLAMLVVINFCLLALELRRFMPWLRDRYLLLMFLALLAALFVLLLKKKPDLRNGCLLVLIAFGAVIFMNLFQAIPVLMRSHRPEPSPPPAAGPKQPGAPGNPGSPPPSHGTQPERIEFRTPGPNVYYFIFDEYGGYDNLQNYYDFDNCDFLEALESRGFSVSYHSRNTEAVNTDTIVPNLLNLDYVVSAADSGHRKAELRRECRLYQMFRENGYRINLINHVDYLGSAGCRVLTSHQTRRTISEYLMRNSIYSKSKKLRALLDDFFVFDYGANYRSGLDNALEAGLSSPRETEGQSTLTVGYIQCPHSPTMVGRHGEDLPFATGWNWRDHSLYLNQLEFMNDYILELTEAIQTQDPDALIILQSDHGNRYAIHMCQLGEWGDYDPHSENPYMQNILNCVYYRDRSFPVEGETGINTLRMMFNAVLGTDLAPIEPIEDYSPGYDDEHS